MKRASILVGVLAILLAALAAGCGGGGDESAGTAEPAATTGPATTGPATTEPATTEAATTEAAPVGRAVVAPAAAITVDGDPSDWTDVAGLDLTLNVIVAEQGEPIEAKDATVRVAHDDENVYVLLEVQDDYNWDPENANLSAASAVMWNIEPTSGPHMGADDPAGAPSAGIVDIWHWELECASGEETGGAVNGPADGDPGNDGTCNNDDEWAKSALEREDDNGSGAENSLLGVWSHTNPTADGEGTWVFEASRPLQTGDEGDAQLSVGGPAQLAVAYWDPDNTPEGWKGDEHVQSANDGWIEVTLAD